MSLEFIVLAALVGLVLYMKNKGTGQISVSGGGGPVSATRTVQPEGTNIGPGTAASGLNPNETVNSIPLSPVSETFAAFTSTADVVTTAVLAELMDSPMEVLVSRYNTATLAYIAHETAAYNLSPLGKHPVVQRPTITAYRLLDANYPTEGGLWELTWSNATTGNMMRSGLALAVLNIEQMLAQILG